MNIPAVTRPYPAVNITVPGDLAGDVVGLKTVPAAEANFRQIAAIAERLSMHSHPSARRDNEHFIQLCLSLAWGIEYGVAKKETPSNASMLASSLKQVCCCKNELALQSAIMVLMISVKNACNVGWFITRDNEELLFLASEVRSYFVTPSERKSKATDFMPIVSGVMSRFYPQLKLGHIVASLEIKPGYGTYMVDFLISKSVWSSQEDNIRLLVAMKDNIDTSSCIVNPQQVNILLNGKGVIHRNNVFMEQGPQFPTELNKLLTYDGTNLLQAVGRSNGHYVILVAFMHIIPPTALPMPQDYEPQSTVSLSSDSEIFEGPSRVCLNCPISFRRISTPVKGYMCKHYQCVDLSTYLEVNYKQRPSWRCPCCNQSVCFPDLRVDQNMIKILKEAVENVTEVIISLDGSWTAASSSNCKDKLQHTSSINPQEETKLPDNYCNVNDITEEDNLMDIVDRCETPEVKPIVDLNLQNLSLPTKSPLPPITNEFNQNSSPEVGNGLSSRTPLYESRDSISLVSYDPNRQCVSLPTNPSLPPITRCTNESNRNSSPEVGNGLSSRTPFYESRDSISPMSNDPNLQRLSLPTNSSLPLITNEFNQNSSSEVGIGLPSRTPMFESGDSVSLVSNDPNHQRLSLTTNSFLPPTTNEFNQNSSPEVGHDLSSRTPFYESRDSKVSNAVSPLLKYRLPDNFLVTNYSTSSPASGQFSASSGLHLQSQDAFNGQSIMHNQFGRASLIYSATQAGQVQMPSPGLQQHSRASVSVPSGNEPSLPPQVARTCSPIDIGNNFKRQRSFQSFDLSPMTSTSLQNRSASQVAGYSTPNHNLNSRMPQTLSQPPHLSQSIPVPRNHYQQSGVGVSLSHIGRGNNSPGTIQPVQLVPQQTTQLRHPLPQPHQTPTPLQPHSVRPGSSFPVNLGSVPQAVSRTENLIDLQSGSNWRPAVRMRGALTGEAYSSTLDRLMGQGQGQGQAPISSPYSSSSPALNALLANRLGSHGHGHGHGHGQGHNLPSTRNS